MRITVTCECGHVTELEAEAPSESLGHCAACGRALSLTPPAAQSGPRTFQQMWQAMQPAAEPTAARSLWDVMPKQTDAAEKEAGIPAVANDAPKPKGLWDVMRPVADVEEIETSPTRESTLHITEPESVPSVPFVASIPSVPLKQPHLARAAIVPRPPSAVVDSAKWCGRAVAAFLFSIAATVFAVLSIKPGWWFRLPPLAVGVIAVVFGFLAHSDVSRSRGRLRGSGLAMLAILVGASGMFLAPIVFARLGERWREDASREEVAARLRRIGQSLDQYHADHGSYPQAVQVGPGLQGAKTPLHGWMTPLLPFLGHGALHQRVDLKQPFDAPANLPAMRDIVPEFTLPGREPERNLRGLAVTQFAGVGGQEIVDGLGLVHFGIFSGSDRIRRVQITDGLSQTLIVGEISHSQPPWGAPGNVRTIGEGLNKAWLGFGNTAGSGATFLHADGSARFYSHNTDRRILEQLSTRDGGETIGGLRNGQ